MCECNRNLKGKAQDAFWVGLIDKYMDRIEDLENEKEILENSVNGMETGLPALLTFKVNKLLNKVPNANINKLLMLPCCCPKETKRYIKPPNLKNMSIFDMTDTDVHRVNIIKHLVEDEKFLVDNINALLDKEIDLMYQKRKLDKLGRPKDSKPKVRVNLTIMEDFNEQLKMNNENLKNELVEVEAEMEHYKELEGPLRELLRNTRLEAKEKADELKSAVKEKEDKNQKTILNLKQRLEDKTNRMKEEVLKNKKLKLDLRKMRDSVRRLEKDVARKILYDTEFKHLEATEEECECEIRNIDYEQHPKEPSSMLVKKCINEVLGCLNKM